MVTGDNKITAIAIAKDCNIISEDFGIHEDSVMEGPEFYKRVGGLICKKCWLDAPCKCPPSEVKEGVKYLKEF